MKNLLMTKIICSLIILSLLLTGCAKSGRDNTGEALAILLTLVNLGFFILLGKYSRLLRDDVNGFSSQRTNGDKLQLQALADYRQYPFSLSKVQLGIWTIVISCSYLYLTLFKNGCSEIAMNKTAIVLMGIFSGAAITSKVMDKYPPSGNSTPHLSRQSQGFFIDILSDNKGINIHRFQHLLWTLIAIVIYLYRLSQIANGCVLPELGDTLLALTGISSASYVIMRSGERDFPQNAALSQPPPLQNASISPPQNTIPSYPDRSNSANINRAPEFYG